MRFTRDKAEKLAEHVRRNPRDEYRLMTDGLIYRCKEGEYNFEKFMQLVKIPSYVEGEEVGRVLWMMVLESMISTAEYEKLKYVTYLEDYLYKTLNTQKVLLEGRIVKPSGNKHIDSVILTQIEHWGYRKRAPIKGIRKTINEEVIRVGMEHTSFINIPIPKKILRQELLELHEEIRKEVESDDRVIAEGKGYENRDFIIGAYDKYEGEQDKFMEEAKELGRLWNWKIEEDGIYEKYDDDKVLREVLYPMNNDLWRRLTKGTYIRKMVAIKDELEGYKYDIENKGEKEIVSVKL